MKNLFMVVGVLTGVGTFAPVWAIKADFENYNEGSISLEFTDPLSGFHFRPNVVNFNIPPFSADYGSVPAFITQQQPPPASTWLSADGIAIGPELGVGGARAFTITFPVPTQAVWMDILYSPAPVAGLTLTGLDDAGNSVAQVNLALNETPNYFYFFSQASLSSATPFTQLVVAPTTQQYMYISYDNITIPEPVNLSILMLGLYILSRLRRNGLN
jgi:hypothetical protein